MSWRRLLTGGVPLLSILGFFVAWQLASLVISNDALLPPPSGVLRSLVNFARSGELLHNGEESGRRLALGFLLAVAIGGPTGLLMAASRMFDDSVDPIVEIIRPISGIAWIPIGLILFGISETLPVFIIAYVAIFPIILSTARACKGVGTGLLRAAAVLGLSRTAVVLRVLFPASLSGVMTGARLGAGGAWLALVAAEFIGAPNGLGFSIWYYGGLIRTSDMIAYIVVTGVGGYLTDRLIRLLQRRLTPWSVG